MRLASKNKQIMKASKDFNSVWFGFLVHKIITETQCAGMFVLSGSLESGNFPNQWTLHCTEAVDTFMVGFFKQK